MKNNMKENNRPSNGTYLTRFVKEVKMEVPESQKDNKNFITSIRTRKYGNKFSVVYNNSEEPITMDATYENVKAAFETMRMQSKKECMIVKDNLKEVLPLAAISLLVNAFYTVYSMSELSLSPTCDKIFISVLLSLTTFSIPAAFMSVNDYNKLVAEHNNIVSSFREFKEEKKLSKKIR